MSVERFSIAGVSIVYTNENDGFMRHRLTVMGEVIDKPSDPKVTFHDIIGGTGIEKKKMEFRTFIPATTNRIATYIKNYNNETVYFTWEKVPDYMTIQAPDSLKADWPGEIIFAINGAKTTNKRGRVAEKCTWTVKNREGNTLGSEQISLTVNYLDDFSRLSPLQAVSAPAIDIKTTVLDFGKVKKGTLGLGGTARKPVILSNTGKSDLIIHSITGEDERILLSALKDNTIKAGGSLIVNAMIKAKDVETESLDSEIYIVCNDPKGPVRRIKVTAEKSN